jgi:hypothetical protein
VALFPTFSRSAAGPRCHREALRRGSAPPTVPGWCFPPAMPFVGGREQKSFIGEFPVASSRLPDGGGRELCVIFFWLNFWQIWVFELKSTLS